MMRHWCSCLALFVCCLFVAPAYAQTACFTELPCNDRGTIVAGHLVPATNIDKCEDDAADAKKKTRLLAEAVADAKLLRRDRDACIGEAGAVGLLMEGIAAERDANLVRATIAESDLHGRWSPTTVFLFGVVVGAVGLGGLVIWVSIR